MGYFPPPSVDGWRIAGLFVLSYTNSMEILGKLFGSPARVKIMRLFLMNASEGIETALVVKRAKVNKGLARKELSLLSSADFIKQKNFVKDTSTTLGAGIKDKKGKTKKKKVKGWFLNPAFPQLEIFKVLLVGSELMATEEISNRFKRAGRIKLLAIAGVFLQDKDSRLDILIVGDGLKKGTIESIIKDIEAEIGKELVYAAFETKEFTYRLNMYDKLIYDILSYPHERIIEAREFSTLPLSKS